MPGPTRAARLVAVLTLLFLAFAAVRAYDGSDRFGTDASYRTLTRRVMAGHTDPITWYARSFALLKEKLRTGEPVGFVTDHWLGLSADSLDSWSRTYLAQYSLLPHLLMAPEDARVVVGHWHDTAAAEPRMRERGYHLLFDAGGGFTLHERRRP